MVNAEFSRIYRFVKLLVNEGFLAVNDVSSNKPFARKWGGKLYRRRRPNLVDLGACSPRKFLNLGSRKSYSSVFLGTFSVNQYAAKCYFPAPEITLGKDWLDQ